MFTFGYVRNSSLLYLTAIGLDLQILSFGESRRFPLNPQKVELLQGGQQKPSVVASLFREYGNSGLGRAEAF